MVLYYMVVGYINSPVCEVPPLHEILHLTRVRISRQISAQSGILVQGMWHQILVAGIQPG